MSGDETTVVNLDMETIAAAGHRALSKGLQSLIQTRLYVLGSRKAKFANATANGLCIYRSQKHKCFECRQVLLCQQLHFV